jgi:hypothetical protein
MKKTINLTLIVLALVLMVSCGRSKGEFAFKTFYDDGYRKTTEELEFDANKEIKWVYAFNDASEGQRVGVIYQKKEIVWVEIDTEVYTLTLENKHIFGTIKDFPEGLYKIVLIDVEENNELIDERLFRVYNDESID